MESNIKSEQTRKNLIITEEISELNNPCQKIIPKEGTGLLIIDMQDRILKATTNWKSIKKNTEKLIKACKLLDIQIFYTEQYPEKLGYTSMSLLDQEELIIYRKKSFSIRNAENLFRLWKRSNIKNLIVCGIETHICIQQSVLDLMSMNYKLYLPIDAAGSRKELDHQVAINRMEKDGCTITTTESIIFEICLTSANPNFKSISNLAKENE